MKKSFVIMIDGISAEKFSTYQIHLPHLKYLANQGSLLDSVTPEFAGTSCPGRTSIINGDPPQRHGIYANKIYDPKQHLFRWANPYDIQTKTLAKYAKEQGRLVANVGYGMVRPEDCDLYIGPWWANEMLMRGRDQDPSPSDQNWLKATGINDPHGLIDQMNHRQDHKYTFTPPTLPAEDPENILGLGTLADQKLLEFAGHLTYQSFAPDLILTEIGITDYYLHKYGTEHPLTELALRQADAMVGQLLQIMRAYNSLDQYNFTILSDHGHAAMPQALYVDTLFRDDPDLCWSSEGGVLLVKPRNQKHAQEITKRLSLYDIEDWGNEHLPDILKDQLLTFVVPENSDISFEASKTATNDVFGPSKYQSNHGMRPGRTEDLRFCIFSGPRVQQQILPAAKNNQIAPTIAKLMDIQTPWEQQALNILNNKL